MFDANSSPAIKAARFQALKTAVAWATLFSMPASLPVSSAKPQEAEAAWHDAVRELADAAAETVANAEAASRHDYFFVMHTMGSVNRQSWHDCPDHPVVRDLHHGLFGEFYPIVNHGMGTEPGELLEYLTALHRLTFTTCPGFRTTLDARAACVRDADEVLVSKITKAIALEGGNANVWRRHLLQCSLDVAREFGFQNDLPRRGVNAMPQQMYWEQAVDIYADVTGTNNTFARQQAHEDYRAVMLALSDVLLAADRACPTHEPVADFCHGPYHRLFTVLGGGMQMERIDLLRVVNQLHRHRHQTCPGITATSLALVSCTLGDGRKQG